MAKKRRNARYSTGFSRLALVAQGIEHRFPKPPGSSAVPSPRNGALACLAFTVACELCAVSHQLWWVVR